MTGDAPSIDVADFENQTTQHATCVAAYDRGVLIIGASGSGKSTLALALMSSGAKLVADDQVILRLDQDRVLASAPTAISGLIEARGVGLLLAETETDVPVKLVISLDQIEQDRLPPVRHIVVMGQSVPLLYKVDALHFPAAVMQFLACGRQGE